MCANIVSHFHKSRTCELAVKTKVDTCTCEDLVWFFPSGEHFFTFRVDVYFSARWHQEIKGYTMGSCFVRPEEFPSSAEIRHPHPHPLPLPSIRPGALNTSDGERLWSDGASLHLSRASLHHSTGRLFPASLLAWRW